MQNPCGGRRWETHDDFMIEVEGQGYPMYAPESGPNWDYMVQTWENWGRYIRAAASRHGVPPSWVLAFATMETGFVSNNPDRQRTIRSPVGAIGIMQIMPFVATEFGYSHADMEDPSKNIDLGAQIMRKHADRRDTDWQLPIIAAKYNAGPARLCDSGGTFGNDFRLYAAHDYPGKVIRWNNSAIELLGVNGATFGIGTAMLGGGIAIGGALAAYAILFPDRFRRLLPARLPFR